MKNQPTTLHPDNISIIKIDGGYLLKIKEQEPLWKQIIKHLFGLE